MMNILLAVFQILFGIGIIGFWIFFFLVETKNPERSEVYFGFEKSFPIPDLLWLTPCLFISAFGLLTEQRFGVFFSITAGSALLFLGLLDISFNVKNGGYTTNTLDTIMNLAMNLLCVIFGPIFMICGWLNL